eukprot:250167-Pyramimonas_sp.AAC.1
MNLSPNLARLLVSTNYYEQWLPERDGVVIALPPRVMVDISRCIDVVNCFRYPTVHGSWQGQTLGPWRELRQRHAGYHRHVHWQRHRSTAG